MRTKSKERGGDGGGRGCGQRYGESFPEEIFPDILREKRALGPLVIPRDTWEFLEHFGLRSLRKVGGRK